MTSRIYFLPASFLFLIWRLFCLLLAIMAGHDDGTVVLVCLLTKYERISATTEQVQVDKEAACILLFNFCLKQILMKY
jgi:hypothetical protein